MNITSNTLKNGLKVILSPDNSYPLIALQIYLRIGSGWELASEAGFSHFTEHLVFKSTRKYAESSIFKEAINYGMDINAYTEYDSTCFHLLLPSQNLRKGLEILSELVMNANFDQQQFELEKMVVLEELMQYENDPEESFLEKIAADYLKISPYRNPIIGNKSNLKKASPEDLTDFYQKYYRPNNAFMIISGDFSEEKIKPLLESYFGNWKKRKVRKIKPEKEIYPQEAKYTNFKNDKKNELLAFVIPELPENHPDSFPISSALKIFSLGNKSRLHKKMFDEKQLVDSIKVNSINGILSGLSAIIIHPKMGIPTELVVNTFIEEWGKFLHLGIEEIELNILKKEYLFAHKYAFELNETLAENLANDELYSSYENFINYPQKVNELTIEKINTTLQRRLAKEKLCLYRTAEQDWSSSFPPRFNLKRRNTTKITKSDHLLHILPNGMKVILKKTVGKPVTGISAAFKVSQLNETIENNGINLLHAGMMIYENEKYSHEQFMNICSDNGINCGILPKLDTTLFHFKCFNDNINVALDLMADAILRPSFSAKYFHNLKKTYKSNINRLKDYPQAYSNYLAKTMFFGEGSNLILSEGSIDSINDITLKQLRTWHKSYYNPAGMVVSIVGDIEFSYVIDHLAELFNSPQTEIYQTPPNAIIHKPEGNYEATDKKLSNSYIHITGRGVTTNERKKYTASGVLSQLIGGEANSIFFNRLREEKGLVYSADFSYRACKEIGYFQAFAITDRINENLLINEIWEIFADLKKKGINKVDLMNAKNYISSKRMMSEESVMSQAILLSYLILNDYDYQYYLDKDARLKEVTEDEIMKLSKEFFNKENLYLHILH